MSEEVPDYQAMGAESTEDETQPLSRASPSDVEVGFRTPFSRLENEGGRLYAHRFTSDELHDILHGCAQDGTGIRRDCPPPPGAPAGMAPLPSKSSHEVPQVESGLRHECATEQQKSSTSLPCVQEVADYQNCLFHFRTMLCLLAPQV